ncbi:hypothetical protein [Brevibacterium moorei]|uniref:hypothetical protein n=1 Tax=Brevibacterium moorei TaxID=2968457 RepID=UPI002795B05A|nr:hypothetical protein [Brevibacterium sp. 68QC2CO]
MNTSDAFVFAIGLTLLSICLLALMAAITPVLTAMRTGAPRGPLPAGPHRRGGTAPAGGRASAVPPYGPLPPGPRPGPGVPIGARPGSGPTPPPRPTGPPAGPSALQVARPYGPYGPAVPLPQAPGSGGYHPVHPSGPPGTPYPARVTRSVLYPNLLLGLACVFVITSALIFASIADSALVGASCIWFVALLSYVLGLVLYTRTRRLHPVGIALTGLGLVLVPIAGALLGGMDLVAGRIAWFISSLAGLACYVLAAYLLRSALVTWFAALFSVSLVLSAVSLTGTDSVFWYLCAVVAIGTAFAVAARLLTPRLPRRFILPHLVLGQFLAPFALLMALVVPFDMTLWRWTILLSTVGLHYLVAAWCLGGRARLALALVLLSGALMAAAAALVLTPAGSGDRGLTAAGAACLTGTVLACGFWLGALLSRSKPFPVLFGPGIAVLAVAQLVGGWTPATGEAPHIAIGIIAGDAAATALLFLLAWRRDLPVARCLAATAGALTALTLAAHLAGAEEAGAYTDSEQLGLLALACGLCAVCAVDILLAWLLGGSDRGGRRSRTRPRQQAASALVTPWNAFWLMLPLPALVGLDARLVGSAVLVVLFLGLLALSYPLRNACLTLAGVPVLTAAALCLYAGIDEMDVSRTWATAAGHSVFIAGMMLTSGGLALFHLALLRRSKTSEARTAVVAQGLYALAFLFVPTFGGMRDEPWATGVVGLVTALVLVGQGCLLFVQTRFAQSWFTRSRPPRPAGAPGMSVVSLVFTAALALLVFCQTIPVWSSGALPLTVPSLVLVGAAATWLAFTRWQYSFVITTVCTFLLAKVVLRTVIDDGVLLVIAAAWFTWALAYACYWVLQRRGSRWITPLSCAFAATLLAILATPFLDTTVPWLHSPSQLLTGVSMAIPALMLALLTARVRNRVVRLVVPELATYVGAMGLAIAAHGIVATQAVVGAHVLLIAAWVWAFLARRRGDEAAYIEIRLVLPMALLTLFGVAAGLLVGGWYAVLFLVDHVALLILGALRTKPWALWWGLVASVAAVVWFLRDLVWLALIVLALVLIGVVIWLLIRGGSQAPRQRGGAGFGTPAPPGRPARPTPTPHYAPAPPLRMPPPGPLAPQRPAPPRQAPPQQGAPRYPVPGPGPAPQPDPRSPARPGPAATPRPTTSHGPVPQRPPLPPQPGGAPPRGRAGEPDERADRNRGD